MKEKKQPKDTALGRRTFLLKSAVVASILSTPTLGSAMNKPPKPPPEPPPPPPPPPPPSNINIIKATDDPLFYKVMESAGISGWEICEVTWDTSDAGMTTFGYLSFYKTLKMKNPFGGVIDTGFRDTMYKYKFNLNEFYDQSGNKDLDHIKIDEVVNENDQLGTNVVDTTYKSELRRKLQWENGWNADWLIPWHWRDEFELWATTIDRASRYPAYGVFVYQFGDRNFGAGLRHIIVYRYEYQRVNGVWMRRARIRRHMFLFGAWLEGGNQWVNYAMDDIRVADRPYLDIIGQALYYVAARAVYLDPLPPGQYVRPVPNFPVAFNGVYNNQDGWNNALMDRRNRLRADLAMAVQRAFGRARGDRAMGLAGAPFLMAARRMQEGIRGLMADPANDRHVPVGGLYLPPNNMGAIERIGGGFINQRIRHYGGFLRPPPGGVIDGGPGIQFVGVEGIFPAINNFWLDRPRVLGLNGRIVWENIPADLQPYPLQGRGGVLDVEEGVEVRNFYPFAAVPGLDDPVVPDVIRANDTNDEAFASQFCESLIQSCSIQRKLNATTLMTIIND